jgi:O-antigen ligase
MKIFLRRAQTEWPAWLAVSFIALLPFRRLAEIPLSIFAIAFLFLFSSELYRARIKTLLPLLLPLFLCFWIPMMASSFDSYDANKSWVTSLAALRFFMAAMSIGVLLHSASLRWQVLRWSSYVLIFWAVDGYVQLATGVDLFGITMHEDRLNALFGDKFQFYGPTLAMLSPLLLEFARRRWPAWAWGASFALVLGAVMIAGMRAGWLAMGMVVVAYFILMFRKDNQELRRATITLPILALIVMVMSYLVSPTVQDRVSRTLTIAQGAESAVDYALSWRLPIFRASMEMYYANPVNGVGVRAFPVAYPAYAPEDDYHVLKHADGAGATHAHNIVLEVMADTGSIGLAGLIFGAVFGWLAWRRMLPANRQEAFPYVLSLILILFPLNSHFAIYGTFTSSLIWFLMGLAAAAWRR